MNNSKLTYFVLTALTIAVVALSVGMSWSLKMVRDLNLKAAVISGPSIDPNLPPGNALEETDVQPLEEDSLVASEAAFLNLITSNELQDCSWASTDLLGQKPLQVKLQTAPNSFLLTLTENNFAQTKTYVLRRGLNVYFWQADQDQGYKLRSTAILEGTWPESERPSIQLFSKVAAEPDFEAKCLPLAGDEAVFTLPGAVNFVGDAPPKAITSEPELDLNATEVKATTTN